MKFRKFVSNLPYSPELLAHVGFYANRIKQENVTRKLSLAFMLLAFGVQIFAVAVSPPEDALANSTNDIIYGGICDSSTPIEVARANLLRAYDSDRNPGGNRESGIRTLFEDTFNISRQDVANATKTRISYTDHSLYTLGRNRNSRDASKDVTIDAADGRRYYLRPISVWNKTYEVSALRIRDGVYIICYCGNIVVKNPPKVELEISKKQNKPNNSKVAPGDTVKYSVTYKNTGNATALSAFVHDPLPYHSSLQGTPTNGGGAYRGIFEGFGRNILRWEWSNVKAGASFTVEFTIRINDNAPDGAKICNFATTDAPDSQDKPHAETNENDNCVVVEKPPDEPPPEARFSCSTLKASEDSATVPASADFEVVPDISGDVKIRGYVFTVNGEDLAEQDSPVLTHTFDKSGLYTISAKIVRSNGEVAESPSCEVLFKAQDQPEDKTEETKSARVITGFNKDKVPTLDPNDSRSQTADGSRIGPGEKVEFTLTIANTGNRDRNDFELPVDDLRDVLEYAYVIDENAKAVKSQDSYNGKINLLGGGTLENGYVSWPKIDEFKQEEIVSKNIYIEVKDPVPSTNTPESDPLSYDCVISNTYGFSETVNMDINCPNSKNVESTVSKLPQTGPAETIAFTGAVIVLAIYLYNRNKQLAKELKLLKSEYNKGI